MDAQAEDLRRTAIINDPKWIGPKATLVGQGIDENKADLIVALLQMAELQNPGVAARTEELTDALKLLSIEQPGSLERLNAELVKIAGSIGAPSIFISDTEQRVKWWRTFTTYLFGAGVAVAILNAFVPIQFGLIAKTVFATGFQVAQAFFSAFSGTSGPDAAAAATEAAVATATATAAGPSMVAGPDLGAIGVTIYALSIVALTKCADIVVGVVSAACSLMTLPNAEKVADLAVQAATIAGTTAGLDKGSDFIVRFYRGDFDAAIAAMIDQGIFDAALNAAINTFLESAHDIKASSIGIRWNPPAPAYSKLFIPYDRQLDVHIMDIIQGTFDDSLKKLGETSRLGSRGEIMTVLSALDKEPPDPNTIIELKNKYGMQILILYLLLSQKSKKARSGYGSHESGTSSQPTEPAEKWVEISDRSASNPASVGRQGTNPYIVDYNLKTLKTQILRATGYIKEDYIPFVYIEDFQGSMDDCMKQVLGCLYNEKRPGLGNIFTAISRRQLSLPKQKEIFDYMSKECKEITGVQAVDNAKINAIAIIVRTMFPQPSAESAAASSLMVPAAAGHFAKIEETSAFNSGQATGKASAASSSATSATGKASVTKTTGFTGKASATKVDTDITGWQIGKRKEGGRRGRKSRRYKKRKATLKRRRIRRRRLTRKGKKRRHTKRR